MIVRDLHVVGVVPAPHEADPVLVVDPDAMLPLSVAAQFLQAIAGRNPQILELKRTFEHGQLASGHASGRLAPGLARSPDFRRLPVGESLDHPAIITSFVNNVNRY
jgi:hypothetical protein